MRKMGEGWKRMLASISKKERAEALAEIKEIQRLGREIIAAVGHDIKIVKSEGNNGTHKG